MGSPPMIEEGEDELRENHWKVCISSYAPPPASSSLLPSASALDRLDHPAWVLPCSSFYLVNHDENSIDRGLVPSEECRQNVACTCRVL